MFSFFTISYKYAMYLESINLSLSICLSVCLCAYLPTYLFIYLFIHFMCMSMYYTHVRFLRSQKRTSDPLDVESQMVESCHVGPESWISIPCKSSKFSYLLSHLSSLPLTFSWEHNVYCLKGEMNETKRTSFIAQTNLPHSLFLEIVYLRSKWICFHKWVWMWWGRLYSRSCVS